MLTGTTTVPPGTALRLVGMLNRGVTVRLTVAMLLSSRPSVAM